MFTCIAWKGRPEMTYTVLGTHCILMFRHYDDPEPFDVNARRAEVERGDKDLYRPQHPSSEPQLRRIQSRSRLETQQFNDDSFVRSHWATS